MNRLTAGNIDWFTERFDGSHLNYDERDYDKETARWIKINKEKLIEKDKTTASSVIYRACCYVML